jgi:hypothetical protein
VRVSTRDDARKLLALAEARVAHGRVGMEPVVALPKCGPLMEEWVGTLVNRNAGDDRSRYRRHLKATFEDVLVRDAQEIGVVMVWIDRQRKAGDLSGGSIRHNMNLLSRFFSWAIERGFAKVNPVRQIPVGKSFSGCGSSGASCRARRPRTSSSPRRWRRTASVADRGRATARSTSRTAGTPPPRLAA